ncbi:MAG TPA: dTMP kinase [Polyangiaceae bacterium]|nr:dTMP kinase [Polyangiaceae bacterium]
MKLRFQTHPGPGKLIVICGSDGSGKTTLENGLVAALAERGAPVLATMQPTRWWREDLNVRHTIMREPVGEEVAQEAIALFALADRYDHQRRVLEPALAAGKVVVCNRYVYSLFSYYMGCGGLDLDWLRDAAAFVYKPDFAVYLSLRAEDSVRRVIEREGASAVAYDQVPETVSSINEAFLQLAGANGMHVVSSADSPQATLLETLGLMERDRVVGR